MLREVDLSLAMCPWHDDGEAEQKVGSRREVVERTMLSPPASTFAACPSDRRGSLQPTDQGREVLLPFMLVETHSEDMVRLGL